MTSGKRPYRRTQWIVNRALQFRFVGAMLAVHGLMGLAALGAVGLAMWFTLYSFELLSDPVSVSLFVTAGWTIVVALVLLSPLVFWAGILLTHKIAGPLVRIRGALLQMTKGQFDVRLALRKGDALTELAEDVNALAAFLRNRPSKHSDE